MSSLKQRGPGSLAIVFSVLLAACSDPPVWSAECWSPDRTWIASAHTIEHGGFGTGGVETIVELRRSGRFALPDRVLAFADDNRAIKLRIRWDGPAHLVVVYEADPQLLYYQVTKTSGIDISVQNVSTKGYEHPQSSTRP